MENGGHDLPNCWCGTKENITKMQEKSIAERVFLCSNCKTIKNSSELSSSSWSSFYSSSSSSPSSKLITCHCKQAKPKVWTMWTITKCPNRVTPSLATSWTWCPKCNCHIQSASLPHSAAAPLLFGWCLPTHTWTARLRSLASPRGQECHHPLVPGPWVPCGERGKDPAAHRRGPAPHRVHRAAVSQTFGATWVLKTGGEWRSSKSTTTYRIGWVQYGSTPSDNQKDTVVTNQKSCPACFSNQTDTVFLGPTPLDFQMAVAWNWTHSY